jgi:hypothetical protein
MLDFGAGSGAGSGADTVANFGTNQSAWSDT